VRHARPLGCEVVPMKFADSPLMARVSRWPMARFWQWLVRYYAFDFVFIVRRGFEGWRNPAARTRPSLGPGQAPQPARAAGL
jgi:hypothetical protein